MANDAREIYEAVIGEVRKELSKIIPQYEERMIQSLSRHCEDIVSNMINTYDRRIEELEKKISVIEKHLIEAEQVLKKANLTESQIKSQKVERKANSSVQEKIDMSRHDIRNGFKFNGWVYYANEDMGSFLYKVRIDGTDNQQLTDYSVSQCLGYSVKDGKLFFKDGHYKECSITIL